MEYSVSIIFIAKSGTTSIVRNKLRRVPHVSKLIPSRQAWNMHSLQLLFESHFDDPPHFLLNSWQIRFYLPLKLLSDSTSWITSGSMAPENMLCNSLQVVSRRLKPTSLVLDMFSVPYVSKVDIVWPWFLLLDMLNYWTGSLAIWLKRWRIRLVVTCSHWLSREDNMISCVPQSLSPLAEMNSLRQNRLWVYDGIRETIGYTV